MSALFDADSRYRWLDPFGEGCSLLIHECPPGSGRRLSA